MVKLESYLCTSPMCLNTEENDRPRKWLQIEQKYTVLFTDKMTRFLFFLAPGNFTAAYWFTDWVMLEKLEQMSVTQLSIFLKTKTISQKAIDCLADNMVSGIALTLLDTSELKELIPTIGDRAQVREIIRTSKEVILSLFKTRSCQLDWFNCIGKYECWLWWI